MHFYKDEVLKSDLYFFKNRCTAKYFVFYSKSKS